MHPHWTFFRVHQFRTVPDMYTSVPPIPTTSDPHRHAPELRRWLGDVGHLIDEHGIDRCGPALDELTRSARAHGIDGGAVSALDDDHSPDPVRARAFARVGSALLRVRETLVGPLSTDAAA